MRVEYGALTDLVDYAEALPDETRTAARLALNDVSRGPGLALYRQAVNADIDFPAGYLGRDRLDVASLATTDKLEVLIIGRDRPTSLARFLKSGTVGKYGVTVQVKRGQTRTIARGFPIKLKNGNIGLAIRLKPGESLRNTRGARAFKNAPGLYLFYGPSVDQVFRGVIDSTTPEVLDLIRQEFYRQFFRLTGQRRASR